MCKKCHQKATKSQLKCPEQRFSDAFWILHWVTVTSPAASIFLVEYYSTFCLNAFIWFQKNAMASNECYQYLDQCGSTLAYRCKKHNIKYYSCRVTGLISVLFGKTNSENLTSVPKLCSFNFRLTVKPLWIQKHLNQKCSTIWSILRVKYTNLLGFLSAWPYMSH